MYYLLLRPRIQMIKIELLNSEKINEQNKKKYKERLEALLKHKQQENKDLKLEEGNKQENAEIAVE